MRQKPAFVVCGPPFVALRRMNGFSPVRITRFGSAAIAIPPSLSLCGAPPMARRRRSRHRRRRGSFGSPTFLVGEAIYFGKDRLGEVEEAILAARQRGDGDGEVYRRGQGPRGPRLGAADR